ncbi:hypothetical protein [Natrinema ejinorense]|uniref:Uncharacterized protein n=1 Tax=Natrinema ejinorense TaxID=373386 RepID=A0A2A5QPC6_9EURY|nr:hypothetical protein [Natrinema ejinorense]PCR88698.1 hypothetical protein CP557_21965 [Natrinema ejinorense]
MHTDPLEIELEGSVTANGDAAQVYFPKQYTQQPLFPLDPGGEFQSLIIPGEAIVLLPASTSCDYPLEFTVRDPESYRLTIEPNPDTESMHTTDSDATDQEVHRRERE